MIVTCPNCGAKNRIDPARSNPACGKCHQPLPKVDASHPIIVTDDSFQRDVYDVRGIPVLVDFWAEWCPPCKMLTPTINALAAESAGRYRIAKLNVDENQRTAAQFNIQGIPAMLIFKDGKKVDEIVGLAPKPQILSKLANYF